MTESQARSQAYAAAAAGVIANILFIAFYASFAVQHSDLTVARRSSPTAGRCSPWRQWLSHDSGH